ncbi:polysaccharide biosynthesis protein [Gemmatimonadetes bacterium T265]|nr:polysaccharide biosynthesis protein [Gemmatimonadetes bacterium T265]
MLLVGLHAVLLPVVYAIAYALRFDGDVPAPYVVTFWATLPLLFVVRLVVFALFRQYNGWWRHAGLYDLAELGKAATLSSVLFWGVAALARLVPGFPEPGFPRSVVILDWGATVLCLGGLRFGLRWMREREVAGAWPRDARRTLIVGADVTAERLLGQLRLDRNSGIHPVGLVDDHPAKAGMRLQGVPVLGTVDDLARLVPRHGIELVVVAITAATRREMMRIIERCTGLGIEVKIVPSLREMLEGRARLNEPRTVRIEDLLGRAPVALDLAAVRADLAGSVVLITGGAGSIGSELARQVARLGPRRLVLMDQAESPLFFVHNELVARDPGLDVVPVIADIAHPRQLERAFALHRPDYVLHAAAYKHVPMMEANVIEAVHNNVLGTFAVAESAVRHGAKKFVMISTDKAVNPSSVMGATKRAAERLVLEWPDFRHAGTDFRAVRFGNVLGSNGSVVPVFTQQIAAGGPVTVTHPETTRYFMTIPEAVQLVLQAAALPEASGRIAMLEMGEPVRIREMAEQLIRLSGLEPYTEMPIVFTGLRPGEKLHEELMTVGCTTRPTSVDKIRVLHEPAIGGALVPATVTRLRAAVQAGTAATALRVLHAIVPEWEAPDDVGPSGVEGDAISDAMGDLVSEGAPADGGRPIVAVRERYARAAATSVAAPSAARRSATPPPAA